MRHRSYPHGVFYLAAAAGHVRTEDACMIACFAVRVVEIAQRRACTHLTSIIIIGARVVRRPRIRCRGRDCHA